MTEPEATAWPLPPGTDTRARAWLVAGAPAGPAPRAAASLCLLRDEPGPGPGADPGEGPGTGARTVQVLWITRGEQLAVAPGALAFPGGAVDDVDRARRPDEPAPPDRFAVLARAASRELAEETGHVVPPRAMSPLVRWVTPEHEPRRFDTTFLVAVLPPGEDPAPLPPGEVHEHGWARPADLLDDVVASRRRALPPTRAVLARLARAVEVTGSGLGRGVGSGGGSEHGSGHGSEHGSGHGSDRGAGGGAAAVADLLRREAVLVPVVPRAVWRGGTGTSEGPDGGGPDFSGRDFSGRDFSGRALSGRALSGRGDGGRDFSGRDLSGRGDGGPDDGARGVDLLLPRHAGEVP